MQRHGVSRRGFLAGAGAGLGALACGRLARGAAAASSRPPNVVIVFVDDLGYGDLGAYGAPGNETPNLDRMCADGMRFTDFYVPQAVCGASRAGLLTGCYPNRLGLLGAPGPKAVHGIHEREMTIAEAVKQQKYATAMFGKWHLGHRPRFLPPRHGFDAYFGLPYSNDMWPHHPEDPNYPALPLIEGERTIAENPDQTRLTTWYTERAVAFVEQNRDRPFFLYVAHNMPHVPLFVSEKFKGKSARGLYGDVVMEIDWSVGEILAAIARCGLDDRTLVFFCSDNGPWLSYGDHGGSAGPLREGKGTAWEGGVRVPGIMRWPGRIPAKSVCREPAMTIDMLPTIAGLAGAALPPHVIDGKDILPLMTAAPDARSPHEALYFYWGNDLHAVRSGSLKLHLPHAYHTMEGRQRGAGGKPGKYAPARTELALYDLAADIGEKHDLAAQRPDLVSSLTERGRAFDAALAKTRRPAATIGKKG